MRLIAAFAVAAIMLVASLASVSAASFVTENLSFRAPDGTVLHASIGGIAPLIRRPLIIEDSPYAPAVSTLQWTGTAYNDVELQWRGTGLSGGSLDATGTLDQQDLSAFVGWACTQPWSNGTIGLYGFSASAIAVYNTLHLPLPCVKATALMAGTVDLYRDLLSIGGIPNIAPGVYVEAAIGLPALADGLTRLEDEPSTIPDAIAGFFTAGASVLDNPNEDAFWQQRTFQGDLDQVPILADTSFYDVEPRGPFMAFNMTKQYGSHLLVFGAHDGSPAGTPGPFPQYKNWFDHYLLGAPLTAANTPAVSVYASNGSREQFLADNVTHLTSTTWPLDGTAWTSLYLSPTRSGTVGSLNDGTLSLRPEGHAQQAYPFIPSEASETDLHTIAVVAGDGVDAAATALPAITDMQLSAPLSLTYTTPPLSAALTAVGPASLDVFVSATDPVTDIYAVVADVWPDGTAYPVATGALRTSYPVVERSRSLLDPQGDIVDPYADFSSQQPALPGQMREYHVELLPIGNHFAAGHRLRLYLVGTPFTQLGSPPGIDTVSVGGITPSRLLLPSVGGGVTFAP